MSLAVGLRYRRGCARIGHGAQAVLSVIGIAGGTGTAYRTRSHVACRISAISGCTGFRVGYRGQVVAAVIAIASGEPTLGSRCNQTLGVPGNRHVCGTIRRSNVHQQDLRWVAKSAEGLRRGFAAFVGNARSACTIGKGAISSIGIACTGYAIQNVVLVARAGTPSRVGFKGLATERVVSEGADHATKRDTGWATETVKHGGFSQSAARRGFCCLPIGNRDRAADRIADRCDAIQSVICVTPGASLAVCFRGDISGCANNARQGDTFRLGFVPWNSQLVITEIFNQTARQGHGSDVTVAVIGITCRYPILRERCQVAIAIKAASKGTASIGFILRLFDDPFCSVDVIGQRGCPVAAIWPRLGDSSWISVAIEAAIGGGIACPVADDLLLGKHWRMGFGVDLRHELPRPEVVLAGNRSLRPGEGFGLRAANRLRHQQANHPYRTGRGIVGANMTIGGRTSRRGHGRTIVSTGIAGAISECPVAAGTRRLTGNDR